jgi:hypothetical protein
MDVYSTPIHTTRDYMMRTATYRSRLPLAALALPLLLAAVTTAAESRPVRPAQHSARMRPQGNMDSHLPSLDEVLSSGQDLWGEAALRQPGGPGYDFFRKLLPPPRYVDAPFRHYPIVLSAPGSPSKARLISNGSGLNLLARQPNWRGEAGVPVAFSIGPTGETFGSDLRRLDGPRYAEGFFPIVQLRYRQGGSVYAQESFAAVEPELSRSGIVFLRFRLETGVSGKVVAQFEGSAPWISQSGLLQDAQGRAIASFSSNWLWNPSRNTLTASLAPGEAAVLAVAVEPVPLDGEMGKWGNEEMGKWGNGEMGKWGNGGNEAAISSISSFPHFLPQADRYDVARKKCVDAWTALLDRGTVVEVPEEVVNRAWRSLVCGSYALLHGDEIRYSAGNQYAKLYIGEGGDAARSLLLWGQAEDVRRMLVPLFDYTRKGLEFHQGAFKLQMLAHYYWLTRDREFLREERPRINKELNVILNGIEPGSGLLPREKYCGDIDTRVYSLNSNANCWRALRDMQAVMADAGDEKEAARLAPRASAFRRAILSALDRSIRKDVKPAFVPIALFGEESPYEPLTGSRMGSYWDLMAPYVLGSGVFPADSEPASAIIQYLQHRGGLCMGLIRSRPNPTFWVDVQNVNELYGLRYTLALLQRDEPDRALVSFYGKLAQGMTRDTFIGAEGTCLTPLDPLGRQMYLPPNSAANGHFLWTLRCLLVQDWDLNDDSRPETLRLLFATPRGWLRDGASIRVRRAPTAFGEVSLEARSALARGEVTVDVDLPARRPERTLLRLRLPEGWQLTGAKTGGNAIPTAGPETLDLTGHTGRLTLHAAVKKARKQRLTADD